MGLQDVVQEVRSGAEKQARDILAAARKEADAILDGARAQAQAYEAERLAQAERDVAQIERQGLSHAQFEARKHLLATEGDLRAELRANIIAGLADIPAKKREGHIKALLGKAQEVIPAGKVYGAKADAKALKAGSYDHAGDLDIAGGLVVESEDGTERLDLSYETLLQDVWRDVLSAEQGLFH